MEKSGTVSQVTHEAAPLQARGLLCTTHPTREKRRNAEEWREGEDEGGDAGRAGRAQAEAGNRRTGTTSLLGVRKSLPLLGPVRVRVRDVSGSSQGCPRAAPKHMHEGNTGTTCLCRAARRCVWRDLGGPWEECVDHSDCLLETAREVGEFTVGCPAGSKSEDENLPYRMAHGAASALLRRGAVTRTPTPRPHRACDAPRQRYPKLLVVTEVVFTFWRGLD